MVLGSCSFLDTYCYSIVLGICNTLGVAILAHKGVEITVEKEKEIDDTPTEETPIEASVESTPTPAKSRRRPKKKKEEVNNEESKERTDTRAETNTNK